VGRGGGEYVPLGKPVLGTRRGLEFGSEAKPGAAGGRKKIRRGN